jgi:APA family basic amino acid/polyamine antiporter
MPSGIFATKSIEHLATEADHASGLKRTLGAFDLITLGIGAIIGAG